MFLAEGDEEGDVEEGSGGREGDGRVGGVGVRGVGGAVDGERVQGELAGCGEDAEGYFASGGFQFCEGVGGNGCEGKGGTCLLRGGAFWEASWVGMGVQYLGDMVEL